MIGLGAPEVPLDEIVPALMRGRLDNRGTPRLGTRGDPMLVLSGDVFEHRLAHGVQLPIGIEETDDAFGLLKGLNQAVEQDAIKAAVSEPDTILVMLVEGVHGCPPGVATRQDKPMNAATSSWQYSAPRAWAQGAG